MTSHYREQLGRRVALLEERAEIQSDWQAQIEEERNLADWIRDLLRRADCLPGPHESLAEALARALGPIEAAKLSGEFGEMLTRYAKQIDPPSEPAILVWIEDGQEGFIVRRELEELLARKGRG